MGEDKAPRTASAPASASTESPSLDHSTISKKLSDLVVHPLHKLHSSESRNYSSSSSSFIGSSVKTTSTNDNATSKDGDGQQFGGGFGFLISGENIRTQLEENLKELERKYKFQIPLPLQLDPSQITIIKSINDLLSQKLDEFITHNMQVLMIGAALGAAISAGVLIGIGVGNATTTTPTAPASSASSSIVSTSKKTCSNSWGLNIYKRWSTWIRRILPISYGNGKAAVGDSTDDEKKDNDNDNEMNSTSDLMTQSQPLNTHAATRNSRHPLHTSLCVLQASPSPSPSPPIVPSSSNTLVSGTCTVTPAEEQCRQCLNSLTISLGKRRLLWDDVLKITAYLVIHQCDARIFRNVLKEFPIREDIDIDVDGTTRSSTNDDGLRRCAPSSSCSIVIVYVQQLEDENSSVQLEALALVQNPG